MPNESWFDRWLPPIGPTPERRPAPPYSLRHPMDADFDALDRRLRTWAEGRSDGPGPWRTWVRHFGPTGWLAEADAGGRVLGLLLGMVSPARPGEAVIERVAVDPEMRRRGIGRALVERFVAQMAELGTSVAVATCRPDDHTALRFLGSLGFVLDEGSGRRLYGVPAYPDWDGEGEDRAILARPLSGPR